MPAEPARLWFIRLACLWTRFIDRAAPFDELRTGKQSIYAEVAFCRFERKWAMNSIHMLLRIILEPFQDVFSWRVLKGFWKIQDEFIAAVTGALAAVAEAHGRQSI